jgi:transcription initiation factor IIE alpha subunit
MAETLTELRELEEDLSDEEKTILEVLGQVGAATPAELAVKTFSLPEEINDPLLSLKDKQLIDFRQVKGQLGGDLVTLNRRGVRLQKELQWAGRLK